VRDPLDGHRFFADFAREEVRLVVDLFAALPDGFAALADFFAAVLPDFRALRRPLGGGTFAPFSRASLRPMAIACFSLVTFLPVLLFSVPLFLRRIADSTLFDAAFPYFAMGLTSGRTRASPMPMRSTAKSRGQRDEE
jgi:hypothetical protein